MLTQYVNATPIFLSHEQKNGLHGSKLK